MLALRALARVVGIVLMVALALLGLGIALYCVNTVVSLGSARPDRLLHLPAVRGDVGHVIAQLEAPGGTAGLALVCGLGAILIGIVLLIATFAPRRKRLAILEQDGDAGTLAARPGPLKDMARALAESTDGVTSVKRSRVALARRGRRGRLTVTAAQEPTTAAPELQGALREQLEPITNPFHLRPLVRIHPPDRGERVQ